MYLDFRDISNVLHMNEYYTCGTEREVIAEVMIRMDSEEMVRKMSDITTSM